MSTTVQQGEAIVVGYRWALRIAMDVAAFPSGVSLAGHVRRKLGDPAPLTTLSTEAASILRVDDRQIDIVLEGAVTAEWPPGEVVMDFVRTDVDPDRYLGFRLTIPVVLPVTRGLA